MNQLSNYLHIEPFVEIELDCVQNLFISLLQREDYDVRYLGALWPWEFVENDNDRWKNLRLASEKCITRKRLKELFDIQLRYYYPESLSELWDLIKEHTKNQQPILCSMDQYYVPYHYPYIYQKQHGFHSTMVTKIISDEKSLCCVSAIPYYKGTISRREFMKGVQACPVYWLASMEFPEKKKLINPAKIYEAFVVKLETIYALYQNKDLASNNIYSPQIIKILEELLAIEDEERMKNELELICDGMWGWTISRKGVWLKEYLRMEYMKDIYKNVKCLDNLINELNQDWEIGFRLLFKGTLTTRIRQDLEKARKKFYSIKEKEELLLKYLILN